MDDIGAQFSRLGEVRKIAEVATARRYEVASARRLGVIFQKKIKTSFIGALAAFQKYFGHLWGDGKAISSLTAEEAFWRWVASWARALRRPSDLGYSDELFHLPPLEEREHIVEATLPNPERLFDLAALGLREEREERRRTITERCEKIAALIDHDEQALVWCHLNAEGDLLAKLIPDAEQVKGSDSDDAKEARLFAFAEGDLRVLVTKPKIGAWGLNLQRCAHITFFPSHSYEQYYQGVRRCWRFGQKRPVVVDIVSTEGEAGIADNLHRKAEQADRMFTSLVRHMGDAMTLELGDDFAEETKVPPWL